MTLTAAAAAALAVWLLVPPDRAGRPRAGVPPWVVASVIALAAVVAAGSPFRLAVWTLVGGAALLLAHRVRRFVLSERAGRARAERVLELCDATAAELRAGLPVEIALRHGAGEGSEWASVVRAAQLGADVPGALRQAASAPGAGDLAAVAAAWQVASHAGAPMADVLAVAADRIRERQATRRLVRTELAGARAAALVMAGLPVLLGVAGEGLGADPVGFLTGSVAGAFCLAGGLAFTTAGLGWLQRIVSRVEGRC